MPSPKQPLAGQCKYPPVALLPKSSDNQNDSLSSNGSGGTIKRVCTNCQAADKLRMECSRFLSAAMLDDSNPDKKHDTDLFILLSSAQSWAKDLYYAHDGMVSVEMAISMMRKITDSRTK